MTETMQRDEYLPDSPYPGINPFSYAHRDVFFAREAEVRALTRLIVMYRGVLLYSDSGTGKSSLINAGVIPLSMTEGFQPERVRVQPKRDEEIIVERTSERVEGKPPFLPSIFTSDKELERVTLSVEDFLERLRNRAVGVYPLIIFDQFEEWVTLFEEDSTGQVAEEATTAQERIRDAIVSLVNDTELPVKILISFREDYLAKIDPLIEQCPNLRDQYLRLTALSGEQIYRAIRGPFEKFPEEYRPELSDSLAKEIQAQFGERSEGADVHLTEVQIVCQNLFEAGRRGEDIDRYFSDEGGVQGILERYLEEALESLEEDQQEPAIGLLSRMVTSAGTRNVISRDDLLSRVENEDGIPRDLLSEALGNLDEKAKLVRRERRREVYYYEIVSEFLVGWIRRKAQERQLQVEQEKLRQAQEQEAEKRRAVEQARYLRIFRRLTVALVVVALLAMGAAVFALLQRQQAMIAKELAQQSEQQAMIAKELAQQSEQQAIEVKEFAQQQQQELTAALKEVEELSKTAEQKQIVEDALKKLLLLDMVLIQAGEFQMGSNDGYDDEKPVHTVYLDAFYMDKYEVTNAQYKEFMDATDQKAPAYWSDSRDNAPNQPVVGVTWHDADAYAKWAGKRLPTEAEWEKAARGGLAGKRYPWGDGISHDNANYTGTDGKDKWEGTSPVGSFPPNGYGLYDMSGNVWEWCADWYGSYPNSRQNNPTGPSSGESRVLRGGLWRSSAYFLRVANRGSNGPDGTTDSVGFRCVSQDSNVTP